MCGLLNGSTQRRLAVCAAPRRGRVTVIDPYTIWLHSTTDGHKHAVPPEEFLAGFKRRLYRAECGAEVAHSPTDAPDYRPRATGA